MASIYDIAKVAGVSYSTVSLILNNRGDDVRISKKTQERVKKIAKDMGYVPNINARKLISKDIKNLPEIALFWSPTQHPIFLNDMISRMNALIKQKSIQPMSVTIYPFETDQLYKMEKILCGNFAHGIIIPAASDEDVNYLKQMDIRTPVINLYSDIAKYHSVDTDSYLNGYTAAKIFDEQNIKKVGIVENVYQSVSSSERVRGFKDYCSAHHMEIIVDLAQIPEGDFHIDTALNRYQKGRSIVEKLLEENLLPQGLFIQEDDSARGIYSSLRSHNIRVPEDVAVICYGYNSKENEEENRLTMIEFPIEALAIKTWGLMNQILDGSITTPTRIVCPTTVHFGRSCPKPKTWDE